MGAHFKALNEAVLMALFKILKKFVPFRVSQPPCEEGRHKNNPPVKKAWLEAEEALVQKSPDDWSPVRHWLSQKKPFWSCNL